MGRKPAAEINGPDFQELHRLYRPGILRHLTRLVGKQEAEDLTQEVFLRASRALKDFEGRSQLSTWLYRIATNAAIDRMRDPSFQRPGAGGSSRNGPPP